MCDSTTIEDVNDGLIDCVNDSGLEHDVCSDECIEAAQKYCDKCGNDKMCAICYAFDEGYVLCNACYSEEDVPFHYPDSDYDLWDSVHMLMSMND